MDLQEDDRAGPGSAESEGTEAMSTGDDRANETLPAAELMDRLHPQLTGTLIDPEAPLYDKVRAVWNGMIDLRPRVIVRAGAVSDVDQRLVTVDPGATLADVDRETARHGLINPLR